MESRIVRIWRAGDQLPAHMYLAHLPHVCLPKGARLTLQHVEADAAEPVNVWVVYLGEEADFGRSHGVVVWEEELELEAAACRECEVSTSARLAAWPSPTLVW